MAPAVGILRQESKNRRPLTADRTISVEDPQTDSLMRLLRRVGEEQQPETSVLVETLRQVSLAIVDEDMAKLVNNYLRSRRSRILSYDNFFRALNDFRSKLWNGPSLGLGWRTRTEPEECSPEDYDTFDALIELVGKIAEFDESSRLHIADNPDWNHPLHVLATLISCAIPTTMKATILTALASFAKSSGAATLIWQYIVPVLAPLTITGPKNGLKLEMEETEVRFREFPVTKAVIFLMSRVFENLASQTMALELFQQLQDFISYIYDAVFLKVDQRSFASPQEHLDVLLACLLLFEKCLDSLNEINLIFVPALVAHPGYILRQRVLEGGIFFEKLISWLMVCLEEHGKKHNDLVQNKLEQVMSHILSIFGAVILRHDEFLKLLKQNDSNAAVANLEILIATTINARSARKDLLFAFCKLLSFKGTKLAIARKAMNVLDFATHRFDDHRDWITLLYFEEKLYKDIMKNFADCLEVDPAAAQQENRDLETSESLLLVQQTLKLLFGVLKNCPFPNMAHVFLGFPIRNGTVVGSALGADALAFAFSRVLELVEPGKIIFEILPTLTEFALDVLDHLCQNQKTSQSVLEFIRSIWTGDLTINKLASQLPLVDNGDPETFKFLRHQKAILHIIAKEIRTLFEEFKSQSAINLLSSICDLKPAREIGGSQASLSHLVDDEFSKESSSLLLRLFSVAELSIPTLEAVRSMQLEGLEHSIVEDALNVSRIATDDGMILHDVSVTLMYLKELLHVYEENGMGRSDLVRDFKTICDYVDRETYLVGLVRARRECFESWSILLCVIAESCPADSFSYPILPTYFLHVMRLLTNKLLSGLPAADSDQIFQTLFVIMVAFVRLTGPSKTYPSLSDTLAPKGYASEAIKMDYKSVIIRTCGVPLTELIRNLITLLLRPTSSVSERRRGYSSFLVLLKWADWNYDSYEDASLGFSQSIQATARSLRGLVKNAMEVRLESLFSILLRDCSDARGPEEAVCVQTLSRLWNLDGNSGHYMSEPKYDILAQLITGLAKDNQLLAECIATQTDTDGILGSFETKLDVMTTWIGTWNFPFVAQDEVSQTLRLVVKTILQLDVVRSLPMLKDARNTLTSVQRAWMTGANASVYGYCNRVFRKLVDLLIAVLRQLRLRPAYNDAMYKTYKYILEYGAVLSDFIREPTGPDDPTWDDISRSVELMSLVNHHFFLREIRDPQNTDLSPEILAIELKLGRLLQSVGNLVVRPPNGNYKTYYSELKQRIRSVQLASDLVTYLRRLMFDGGTEQINLAVVRPVFARSQIFGRSVPKNCSLPELARGSVSVSYGDLIEHVKTFCGLFMNRTGQLESIRTLIVQSVEAITETDLQTVLDSQLLPSKREDKRNFYTLFLKEQERDICVDLRQLLNCLEALLMVFVTHLEYAYCQFSDDSRDAAPLPPSMRRALLPALEQDDPTTPYNEHQHFKSNICDFVSDDLIKQIRDVFEKTGSDVNRFLGIYLSRLIVLVNEART